MSYLREKILDWLHTTLQHYSRTETLKQYLQESQGKKIWAKYFIFSQTVFRYKVYRQTFWTFKNSGKIVFRRPFLVKLLENKLQSIRKDAEWWVKSVSECYKHNWRIKSRTNVGIMVIEQNMNEMCYAYAEMIKITNMEEKWETMWGFIFNS